MIHTYTVRTRGRSRSGTLLSGIGHKKSLKRWGMLLCYRLVGKYQWQRSSGYLFKMWPMPKSLLLFHWKKKSIKRLDTMIPSKDVERTFQIRKDRRSQTKVAKPDDLLPMRFRSEPPRYQEGDHSNVPVLHLIVPQGVQHWDLSEHPPSPGLPLSPKFSTPPP